jgi:thiol-disulfide isomerase/thioredoxin
MLRTVDGGGFNRIVMQGSGRVAVEFMSYGCGYCRAIEPILQRVASAIAADVTILREHRR